MAEKNESHAKRKRDSAQPQGISPLPFLNIDFLKSPAARTIRILSEYLEPADRLRRARIRDTIVFFGSARSPSPEEAAERLAEIHEQLRGMKTPTAELADARRRARSSWHVITRTPSSCRAA
jgi:hypothetical protein